MRMRTRKNVFVYKNADEATSHDDDNETNPMITDVDVHESVKQIPSGAFCNYRFLVNVKFPQGLREIGTSAFKSCICLEELSIPSSVETIGDEAFFHCRCLKIVMLVEGLRTIGKNTFRDSEIGILSIPASVTSIGESAFEACRNVRLVILREGLQQIGSNAFKGCSLPEVDIPSSVVSVGEGAFHNCFSLKRAGFGGNRIMNTNIAQLTFGECFLLGIVSLPQTLTSIDKQAFFICSSISAVVLPEGLQCIGESAFMQCSLLKEIRIPNTVVSIGWGAFSKCFALKDVNFGEGLRTIGDYAFFKCLSLSGISLPSSMEQVGESAFASCTKMTAVEFQNGQNIEIKPRVFVRCEALINISIPSSMEDSVWAAAFDECASLEQGAGGSDFIVQRLKNRFADHPVHEACYHSSLQTLLTLKTSFADYDLVDGFQMTPFHIAVTASNLREDILECLLEMYHFPVLFQRDRNGKTMMDYLLKSTRNGKARDLIDMVLRKGILEATSGWGLPEWRSKVFEAGNQYFTRSEEMFPRTTLDSVGQVFAKYVKLESISLLELALWNTRMIRSLDRGKNKRQKVDRDTNRLMCGANIVIPNVLGFLGDLPTLTSSMTFW